MIIKNYTCDIDTNIGAIYTLLKMGYNIHIQTAFRGSNANTVDTRDYAEITNKQWFLVNKPFSPYM